MMTASAPEARQTAWMSRGVVAVAGVCIMLIQLWPYRERIAAGGNDFLGIYVGALLVGTGHLYDADAARQVQEAKTGMSGEAMQFVRPPFYAALLYPLRFLPYRAAYFLWELMLIGAVVGFLALWPGEGRSWMPLACAWSVPLFIAVANGQDVPILLFLVSLCARWAGTRPKLAGAVLALCSIKFHLFLLVPVLLAMQRRRGMLIGAGVVLAGLGALAFVAAGPDWPARYVETVFASRVNPSPALMVTLHGMSERIGAKAWLTAILSLAAAGSVTLVFRRAAFSGALALALIAGVLVGGHAYIHDAALMLPGLVTLAARFRNWVGSVAILLLTPLPYDWLLSGSMLAVSIQLGALGLLAGAAYRWRVAD